MLTPLVIVEAITAIGQAVAEYFRWARTDQGQKVIQKCMDDSAAFNTYVDNMWKNVVGFFKGELSK